MYLAERNNVTVFLVSVCYQGEVFLNRIIQIVKKMFQILFYTFYKFKIHLISTYYNRS